MNRPRQVVEAQAFRWRAKKWDRMLERHSRKTNLDEVEQ